MPASLSAPLPRLRAYSVPSSTGSAGESPSSGHDGRQSGWESPSYGDKYGILDI